MHDYHGSGADGDEPNFDPVYYRVYLDRDDMICVVCMQSFDEYDYREDRFARDADGERLRFGSETEARAFVNRTYRREVIRSEDLTPAHPSFLLAGDESLLCDPNSDD